MANFNRLYVTALLIRYSLCQPKGSDQHIIPEPAGMTRIAAEGFVAALSDISRLLRPDNRLELFFEGALSPAAPFLLYRLKSSGFSGCHAIASSDGILLTAMR